MARAAQEEALADSALWGGAFGDGWRRQGGAIRSSCLFALLCLAHLLDGVVEEVSLDGAQHVRVVQVGIDLQWSCVSADAEVMDPQCVKAKIGLTEDLGGQVPLCLRCSIYAHGTRSRSLPGSGSG